MELTAVTYISLSSSSYQVFVKTQGKVKRNRNINDTRNVVDFMIDGT